MRNIDASGHMDFEAMIVVLRILSDGFTAQVPGNVD